MENEAIELPASWFRNNRMTPSDFWEMTPFEFDYLWVSHRPRYDLQTPEHLAVVNRKLERSGKPPVVPDWLIPSAARKQWRAKTTN